MSNIFMVSIGDAEILNRDGEVFATGKVLLDTSFEKDVISGEFKPVNKTLKMNVCDCEYFDTKKKPYPEKIRVTCQIVSMELNSNHVSHTRFLFENIYLYNSCREIERILNRRSAFNLTYSDSR
jgi:hypothetical protein